MTKQVRETAAGKSVSAYVILNRKGEHVATVQAHFSDGGTCTVDVWNHGDGPAKRSAEAMGYVFGPDDRVVGNETKGKPAHAGDYAYKVAGLQQGRAGGYGYDKFTAALSGLIIDGHAMSDHCGGRKSPPKGRTTWPRDAKAPRGYSFNNFQTFTYGKDGERVALGPDSPAYGYSSCYRLEGFKYLEAFGYRVIQAI